MASSILGEIAVLFGFKLKKGTQNEILKSIKQVKTAALALTAVLGVRKALGWIEDASEQATHLISLSHAMGMTVEQTQLWGYVAQQSGSNLKELSLGMNMFIRNAHEVAQGRGGKALRELFHSAGLNPASLKSIASGSAGLNAELFKMADVIAKTHKVSEPMEALFTKMFGVRAGRAMLADLSRGSAGLKELFERRKAMGLLDEQQAMKLRDLGNRIQDVKTQFNMLWMQAVAAVGPRLIEMLERVMHWVQENKEQIGNVMTTAVKVLGKAFELLGKAIVPIVDLFKAAFGGDINAQAILIGIAAAIMSFVIPSIIAFAGSLVGLAIAAAPFLIIATAIALAALQIYKHWGGISAWVSKQMDTIENKVSNGWDRVVRAFHGAWEWFAEQPIIKQLLDLVDKLRGFAGGTAINKGIQRAARNVIANDPKTPTATRIRAHRESMQAALASSSADNFDDVGAVKHKWIRSVAISAMQGLERGGGAAQSSQPVTTNITQNVTINGVKDAKDALPAMKQSAQDAMDQSFRHAGAAHGYGDRP